MMIRTQKPEESSWISLSNIDQFKKKAFALYGWHVIGLQFRWYPTVKRWRINSQTNRITFNKKVQNKNNGRERKWSIGNGRKAAPNANRNREMRATISIHHFPILACSTFLWNSIQWTNIVLSTYYIVAGDCGFRSSFNWLLCAIPTNRTV